MLLAYDDEGSGPAVLLLHSSVGDRRMWEPIVPTLSESFRVIRPDLRGFGDSALPGEVFTDADDVAHVLDHLGIDAPVVVGSSYGGRIAMELAVRHPSRVHALVLLCPAYRGLDVTDSVLLAFGEREDALLEADDLDGAVELNVATWLGPEATAESRAALGRMQRRAFEVQLAADAVDPVPDQQRVPVDPQAVAAPTLVVSGAFDLTHFRDIAVLLAREIPGAELVDLPWAGHLPALERPDLTAGLILDRLRTTVSRQP